MKLHQSYLPPGQTTPTAERIPCGGSDDMTFFDERGRPYVRTYYNLSDDPIISGLPAAEEPLKSLGMDNPGHSLPWRPLQPEPLKPRHLLTLASKDGPGHNLLVDLDEEGNIVFRLEDDSNVLMRLTLSSLRRIHDAAARELGPDAPEARPPRHG